MILSYLFYINSQVDYYVNNYPTAFGYFILVPFLLASGAYLTYLYINNRIKIFNLAISLCTLIVVGIWSSRIVYNDIYDVDRYSVFFENKWRKAQLLVEVPFPNEFLESKKYKENLRDLIDEYEDRMFC